MALQFRVESPRVMDRGPGGRITLCVIGEEGEGEEVPISDGRSIENKGYFVAFLLDPSFGLAPP